jgi:hypothetical protein
MRKILRKILEFFGRLSDSLLSRIWGSAQVAGALHARGFEPVSVNAIPVARIVSREAC